MNQTAGASANLDSTQPTIGHSTTQEEQPLQQVSETRDELVCI